MNHARALKTPDCEILLLFFVIGALGGTLFREKTAELLLRIPHSTVGCFAAILALDASLTGTLLAWVTFPLITLFFGTAATAEASEILTLGLYAARERLFALAVITPLHFFLGVWSLHTAGKLRRTLCHRGREGKIYILSFMLAGLAYFVCFGLIYLRLRKII